MWADRSEGGALRLVTRANTSKEINGHTCVFVRWRSPVCGPRRRGLESVYVPLRSGARLSSAS